jgi:hypothetical protein
LNNSSLTGEQISEYRNNNHILKKENLEEDGLTILKFGTIPIVIGFMITDSDGIWLIGRRER